MHADRIMVLEDGRCVQLGTHAELAEQPGNYQRLCKIQGALDAQILQDVDNTKTGAQTRQQE
jgi:ABC-type transport system involved in cytochrome bd biosynthesis fused ATPase/permease subunit